MKNLAYVSLAFYLLIVLIEGCQKGQIEKVLTLVATKTVVKYNEPDTLILLGANNDSVKWSINPSGFNGIYKDGNKARIVFTKAGIYTVSATDAGHTPLSKTITVLNQDFNPSASPPVIDTPTRVSITGDLIITPTYFKRENNDSTGFYLHVKTSDTYTCTNTYLRWDESQVNNNFLLNIIDAIKPTTASCAVGNVQLKVDAYYPPMEQNPATFGNSYPLTIKVGNTTYRGSVVLNASYINITWDYTSGVIFTSKHITL